MNQFNDSCQPDSRMAVELADMLNARERRVCTQRELLAAWNCPLISFTMNIPGPVKLLPHVTDAFQDGLKEVEGALARLELNVVHGEMIREKTGWEAFLSVDGTPEAVKAVTVAIEDGSAVGRLYDLDVIRPDGSKVSREDLGLSVRKCLLCGQPAQECARSRRHSVRELTEEIGRILRGRYGA